MTECSRFLRAAGVCLLGVTASAAGESRAPARVYTNDDLVRVSGRRGETGVESRPLAPAEKAPPPAAAPGGGESHWRGEAERVRRRVDPWRDAAADLRVDIATRQSAPGVRPYTDPQVRAMQRRLEALEARIRDAEDRLEERARRARALPGWLR